MASVKYGSMVVSLRGKVGGQNFQTGNAVAVLRNISTRRRLYSVQPVGSKVSVIRGKFAYVAASWRSLSAAQQSAWVAVTSSFPRVNKYGTTYTPSAFQLFCELSCGLVYLGSPIATSAPAVSSFAASTWSISYAGSGGDIIITQGAPFTSVPYLTIISACTYQSAGRTLVKGRLKILATYQFKSSAQHYNIATNFYALFGSYKAGTIAYFSVRQINTNTGEQNAPFVMSVVF